jgi:hypothetical protein
VVAAIRDEEVLSKWLGGGEGTVKTGSVAVSSVLSSWEYVESRAIGLLVGREKVGEVARVSRVTATAAEGA